MLEVNTMTLAELRSYVRDLTGVYSTDILPDTLVNRWLQEAYTEVSLTEPWPWMVSRVTGTLAAGGSTITLSGCGGRVREVVFVTPNGQRVQIPSAKFVIRTVDGDESEQYSVSSTTLTVDPVYDVDVVYDITFYKAVPALATSGTASSIGTDFEHILAYRAAIKVLNANADDTERGKAYIEEYLSLVDSMRRSYLIDDDLGSIQLGGEILRTDGNVIGRQSFNFRGF
jgi:hypothetical protein